MPPSGYARSAETGCDRPRYSCEAPIPQAHTTLIVCASRWLMKYST